MADVVLRPRNVVVVYLKLAQTDLSFTLEAIGRKSVAESVMPHLRHNRVPFVLKICVSVSGLPS